MRARGRGSLECVGRGGGVEGGRTGSQCWYQLLLGAAESYVCTQVATSVPHNPTSLTHCRNPSSQNRLASTIKSGFLPPNPLSSIFGSMTSGMRRSKVIGRSSCSLYESRDSSSTRPYLLSVAKTHSRPGLNGRRAWDRVQSDNIMYDHTLTEGSDTPQSAQTRRTLIIL